MQADAKDSNGMAGTRCSSLKRMHLQAVRLFMASRSCGRNVHIRPHNMRRAYMNATQQCMAARVLQYLPLISSSFSEHHGKASAYLWPAWHTSASRSLSAPWRPPCTVPPWHPSPPPRPPPVRGCLAGSMPNAPFSPNTAASAHAV